jgi:hypothetical protein
MRMTTTTSLHAVSTSTVTGEQQAGVDVMMMLGILRKKLMA